MVLQRKHCPKTYKVDIRASYPTQLLTFQINTHLKADVNNKFLWAYQPTICQVFKTLCLTKALVLQGGCMFHNLQAKKKKNQNSGDPQSYLEDLKKLLKVELHRLNHRNVTNIKKCFPANAQNWPE